MTWAPTAQDHWPMRDDNVFYREWHAWAFVNDTNFKNHRQQYDDTAHWIQQHIPDWAGDAQWKKMNDCFYIRLRREQDAILFALKFGPPNYDNYESV